MHSTQHGFSRVCRRTASPEPYFMPRQRQSVLYYCTRHFEVESILIRPRSGLQGLLQQVVICGVCTSKSQKIAAFANGLCLSLYDTFLQSHSTLRRGCGIVIFLLVSGHLPFQAEGVSRVSQLWTLQRSICRVRAGCSHCAVYPNHSESIRALHRLPMWRCYDQCIKTLHRARCLHREKTEKTDLPILTSFTHIYQPIQRHNLRKTWAKIALKHQGVDGRMPISWSSMASGRCDDSIVSNL